MSYVKTILEMRKIKLVNKVGAIQPYSNQESPKKLLKIKVKNIL